MVTIQGKYQVISESLTFRCLRCFIYRNVRNRVFVHIIGVAAPKPVHWGWWNGRRCFLSRFLPPFPSRFFPASLPTTPTVVMLQSLPVSSHGPLSSHVSQCSACQDVVTGFLVHFNAWSVHPPHLGSSGGQQTFTQWKLYESFFGLRNEEEKIDFLDILLPILGNHRPPTL